MAGSCQSKVFTRWLNRQMVINHTARIAEARWQQREQKRKDWLRCIPIQSWQSSHRGNSWKNSNQEDSAGITCLSHKKGLCLIKFEVMIKDILNMVGAMIVIAPITLAMFSNTTPIINLFGLIGLILVYVFTSKTKIGKKMLIRVYRSTMRMFYLM